MAAKETEIERLVVRLVGDARKYQEMLKEAASGAEKLRAVAAAEREHNKVMQAGAAVTRSVETATEKYQREVAELNELLKKEAISQQTYNRAVKEAHAALPAVVGRIEKFARGVQTAGANLRSAGRNMSLYLTAPLVGLGAFSVREFSRFDEAMTGSLAIMQTTERQSRRMRQEVLDLSTSGAIQTPTELGKSYFYLASAGKNVQQSLALLSPMARFATAGKFDMALATDLLTDAQSALGLSTKNVAVDMRNAIRLGDAMAKANTLANASIEQFSESLTTKAGAALKAFNKDAEEGLAVLAAMADQGIKGRLAGEQLDRIIRLLSQTARENADVHRELGFRVFDEAGEMRNLGDIVINLEDILRGMSSQMKTNTLDALGFEARIQQAILPLIGTGNAIRHYESQLRKAGGTTREVSDKQLRSFASQTKQVLNHIRVLASEIGGTLAPAIAGMGGTLQEAIGWWRRQSQGVKTTVVVIGSLVAVLGPLSVGLGVVLGALGPLIVTVKALAASAVVAKVAMVALPLAVVGVAFVALKASVAAANAELKVTAERLADTRENSLRVIAALKGQRREEELNRRTTAAVAAVKHARGRLRQEEQSQGMLAGIGKLAGIDSADPYRQQLAEAEKHLRDLWELRKSLREEEEAEAEAKEQARWQATQNRVNAALDARAAKVKQITEGLREEIRGLQGEGSLDLGALAREGVGLRDIRELRALKQERDALAAKQDAMQRGASIMEQYLSPLERLRRKEADLLDLWKKQAITRQVHDRAVSAARKEYNERIKGVNGESAAIAKANRLIEQAQGPQRTYVNRIKELIRLRTLSKEEGGIDQATYLWHTRRAGEQLQQQRIGEQRFDTGREAVESGTVQAALLVQESRYGKMKPLESIDNGIKELIRVARKELEKEDRQMIHVREAGL